MTQIDFVNEEATYQAAGLHSKIDGMFAVKRTSFGLRWTTALFAVLGEAEAFVNARANPEDWEIVSIDEVIIRPRSWSRK